MLTTVTLDGESTEVADVLTYNGISLRTADPGCGQGKGSKHEVGV